MLVKSPEESSGCDVTAARFKFRTGWNKNMHSVLGLLIRASIHLFFIFLDRDFDTDFHGIFCSMMTLH